MRRRRAKRWAGNPKTTAREMCAEMMVTDLDAARRHALLLAHGYNPNAAKEN